MKNCDMAIEKTVTYNTPSGKIHNTKKGVIISDFSYVNTQNIISLRTQIILSYEVSSFFCYFI